MFADVAGATWQPILDATKASYEQGRTDVFHVKSPMHLGEITSMKVNNSWLGPFGVEWAEQNLGRLNCQRTRGRVALLSILENSKSLTGHGVFTCAIACQGNLLLRLLNVFAKENTPTDL